MRHPILSFAFALAITLAFASPGFAAAASKSSPKLLGTFGAWKAYAYDDKNQPVCYMTLVPKLPQPKKFKRGQTYLTVTHRPAENSKDVVSFVAGYNYKTTSDVSVDAGKKNFNLFTQKDTAWSRDAGTDHMLAAAIRDNTRIKFTGTPDGKNATAISDTLDITGAGAAYRAIGKACGYPVEAAPKPKAAPAKKKK